MNRIFRQLTGGNFSEKQAPKPKRTKIAILAIIETGEIIGSVECDPKYKRATIAKTWKTYKKATILNVIPLRGRTAVLRRN